MQFMVGVGIVVRELGT